MTTNPNVPQLALLVGTSGRDRLMTLTSSLTLTSILTLSVLWCGSIKLVA